MEEFGLVLALLAAASMALQQEFVNVEWEYFKEKYGKAPMSAQEEARRKHIFEQNIELIMENNKKYAEGNITYKLAMNRFGDMLASEEEFPSGRRTNLESRSSPAVALDITNFPEIDRSKRGGISAVPEQKCLASYPYHAKSNCTFNRTTVAPNTTMFAMFVPVSKEDIEDAILSHGPFCVAICGSYGPFRFYSEGVFDDPQCTKHRMDHTVVLVGYGATKQGNEHWVIKNSWGEDWGERGFMRIKANIENECGSLRFHR